MVQLAAVLLWWSCSSGGPALPDPARIGLLQWLTALALVAYGQSLNVGIFSAIGHDGVYYGFKLGKEAGGVCGHGARGASPRHGLGCPPLKKSPGLPPCRCPG